MSYGGLRGNMKQHTKKVGRPKSPNPRDKQIVVLVSAEEKARIQEVARAYGISVSKLLRDEGLAMWRELQRDIQQQELQQELKIEFEHIGLTPLLNTQDRTSNRLAFAIVIASLVIGSSLIIHSGIPPKWHDIPLIGLAGYVVAGLMGFWLVVSILRRGRM